MCSSLLVSFSDRPNNPSKWWLICAATNFIGNIFVPNKRGHLQNLMEMDPIDIETVSSSP
ncbi:hypothetical protein M5K25_013693 [Dendrobium thyrsiflorum]|uniref:Uncharacterized protein n=1 Tax=Dendrobium thyrsiflorum TaxID=117978 RepID=A0ABD0UTZ7_DENTH